MVRPLRLLYALGPGNVTESYRRWRAGDDVLTETSRTFSSQFFEFCRRNGHSGYAISYFGEAERLLDESIVVENRPKRLTGSGLRYHVSQVLYGGSLMLTALRWHADALIVDSGTTHWAMLGLMKLTGIRVIGVLHNVPWANGFKPAGRAKRIVFASEGWFWRRIAAAAISCSPEIERQVAELAGGLSSPAVQFRAQFNQRDFASISAPPSVEQAPLRVMFAGRIERFKGVFDILEMAQALEKSRPGRVQFDICGGGPALQELNDAIQSRGLGEVVRTHGRLVRPDLLKVYGSCHLVIVPTRSDFCEGMPMVAAEAILCGRPVITSPVSNAGDVLTGAIVMAVTNDPKSYAEAIGILLDDPASYQRLCAACPAAQAQFYDPATSLTAAFERFFSTPPEKKIS